MKPYWSKKRFPRAFYTFLRDNGCKFCRKCGRILPLDSFSDKKRSSDGKSATCRECMAQYYTDNTEYFKDHNARWRKDNAEHRSEYQAQYRKDNEEYIKEKQAQYVRTPHGRAMKSAAQNRRRARQNEVYEVWTAADIEFCLERAGHQCESCGMSNEEHITLHGQRLHMDHIKPLSEGYALTRDNCQVLCVHCNSRKGKNLLDRAG